MLPYSLNFIENEKIWLTSKKRLVQSSIAIEKILNVLSKSCFVAGATLSARN